jgi:acyl-CoA synthetase (AMP-forming)/AMP-acid ligase II
MNDIPGVSMADVFGGHRLGIPYRSISDVFARYAARDPRKTAIVDLDQNSSITFGELDQITRDIAASLKRHGVKKGSRVLLLSDECLEKLLIWFGAWRIGAVPCPLNVEINQNMMVDLTRSVNPALILCHRDLDMAALVGDHPAPRISFGLRSEPRDPFFSFLPVGTRTEDLPERNNPEDIACIFCTSGTTARPKIVVYDHAAYWLNGLSTLEFLGLTEDDRTLEYRSFGWNSAQVLSLMPFLQVGPTMHVARRFSHSRFFEWIKTYGITFSAGVPTVLNMLLHKPLGYSAKDIPTLKLMTCSTAPLTEQQWVQFEETYGVKLLQLYGMSEAGWVCGNRHYKFKLGTVGLAAHHQEFEIIGADGRACPDGVEGEVTAGGPQTAIGYLLDDGTIEPIRPKRIKTGDLAFVDADGFVHISGRTKDLIIRGGMNIAPLEIDAVLLKHPEILDAAAFGIPDEIYGEEVACYVVPKDAGLTEASVRRHCEQHLPLPKTPKRIRIVSGLPKSDRGKVLRDKLREDWAAQADAPA